MTASALVFAIDLVFLANSQSHDCVLLGALRALLNSQKLFSVKQNDV
ncbi:hypothetical protein [Haemophilus pittmaniae]|nr:hypothetical protein [Haemophilus pittmaniae]